MITSILQSAGGSLQELLRSMQKGQEETLEAATAGTLAAQTLQAVSTPSASANALSSNLMSRNFASAEREESKYLSALKASFDIEQQMTMSRNEVIVASVASAIADAAFWYGDERMRRAKTLKDSVESNEENLKEIRDNIEEKAAEAVANAAGQPTVSEGTQAQQGESGQAGTDQAPMPEISDSNPAPAPDVAAAPAPEVSAAAAVASTPAPAPKVSTPVAPATPSINVVV
jgi:hypothetical protein